MRTSSTSAKPLQASHSYRAVPHRASTPRVSTEEQASPHHAGYYNGIHPEATPYTTEPDLLEDELQKPPLPRSKHLPDCQPRRVGASIHTTHRKSASLIYVGVGMLVAAALLSGATFAYAQEQRINSDWTFQYDAVVGHNDSRATPSHFLALNYHQHIEIIEFPAGDPTQAKIYDGPLLSPDQDAAITFQFKDVNGDGKPDMLIQVGQLTYIYLNAHGQFSPLRESTEG
ncbi:hypothetical protein EPA93_32635 [Ktedonosporobacter rubrisoli]|uniref:VCBS repeat-containing protein n=1 Tax=Ktedonosporobacter rubrisoli TaxID=2509675 RepID=A0A4P6JZD5_KTERU|nr:hypothetical protein [Ktedonosporobacter rubrisoli]QBD80466.1 hypothetical protein EPA93_32635 [Ktedonosporobacter rubrisoli]